MGSGEGCDCKKVMRFLREVKILGRWIIDLDKGYKGG